MDETFRLLYRCSSTYNRQSVLTLGYCLLLLHMIKVYMIQ